MSKPITVSVTLSFEIDPEAWDMDYGTGTAVAAVRADVKTYVAHTFDEPASSGMRLVNYK